MPPGFDPSGIFAARIQAMKIKLSLKISHIYTFFSFFTLHKVLYESSDVDPGQQSINVSMYGSADASTLVAVARNMDVIQKRAEMRIVAAGNRARSRLKFDILQALYSIYSPTMFKIFNALKCIKL